MCAEIQNIGKISPSTFHVWRYCKITYYSVVCFLDSSGPNCLFDNVYKKYFKHSKQYQLCNHTNAVSWKEQNKVQCIHDFTVQVISFSPSACLCPCPQRRVLRWPWRCRWCVGTRCACGGRAAGRPGTAAEPPSARTSGPLANTWAHETRHNTTYSLCSLGCVPVSANKIVHQWLWLDTL